MGLWAEFKKRRIKKKDPTANIQAISLGRDFVSKTDYDAEFNSTYCNCVECLARHLEKIQPETYNTKGRSMQHFEYLNFLLQYQPNPLQNACNFWHSMAHEFYMGGIAFAYIEWDHFSDMAQSKVKAIWSISPSEISQVKIVGNKTYIQFSLSGDMRADTIDNFIVLVKSPTGENPYNNKDVSMQRILKVLATNEEGIIKSIENSNAIKYIVTTPSVLAEEKIRDNQAKIDERLKSANSVLYLSSVDKFEQINTDSTYVSSADVAEMKKEVHYHFGINEKVLDSSTDEYGHQAFHEGVLESWMLQVAQELTVKIFSRREFEMGNRIRVATNPLAAASLETLTKVADVALKIPSVVPNNIYRTLRMPETPNGDKEVQSLNYVASDQVDKYQMAMSEADKVQAEQAKQGDPAPSSAQTSLSEMENQPEAKEEAQAEEEAEPEKESSEQEETDEKQNAESGTEEDKAEENPDEEDKSDESESDSTDSEGTDSEKDDEDDSDEDDEDEDEKKKKEESK